MLEGEIDDVARTLRKMLRRGEACELLYHHDVPALRLVFVPVDPIMEVGAWTEQSHVVATCFPPEMRDASLEDSTLVAWLGVGSALLRIGGEQEAPTLMQLRLAFPGASISGLRALGALLYLVCTDPLAAAKADEARALAAPPTNARREYEMTEQQHNDLTYACRPVPYIIVGGVPPISQQANVNAAWKALGAELGFDWDSVEAVPGKGARFFTAMPL